MADLVFAPNAASAPTSVLASWIDTATGLAPAALPAAGDTVAIGPRGNSGTGITSALAASGATSITLSGTSISLVAGTIIKITGTTGVYVIRAARSGNGAVSVSPALRAAVAASSVVTYFNGCDEAEHDIPTATWGSDTTGITSNANGGGAIMVSTKLKWSRSVATALTLRGSLFVAPMGRLDQGTSSDRITAVVHTITLNNSASISAGKHWVQFGTGTAGYAAGNGTGKNWTAYGIVRARATRILASISAGATSVQVADITGWAVGDSIRIGNTDNSGQAALNHAGVEDKTITGITPGSGTTGTVSWSGGLTYGHTDQGYVYNLTSNIVWTGVSNTQRSMFAVECAANSTIDDYIDIDNVRFDNLGSSIAGTTAYTQGISFYFTGSPTAQRAYHIANCVFDNARDHQITHMGGSGKAGLISASIFAGVHSFGSSFGFIGRNGGFSRFDDCHFYMGSGGMVGGSFGFGDGGTAYNRCVFNGNSSGGDVFSNINGNGLVFTDCFFGSCQRHMSLQSVVNVTFVSCAFGVTHPTYGGGTGTSASEFVNPTTFAALPKITMRDCLFDANGADIFNRSFLGDVMQSSVRVINKNQDPTGQEDRKRDGDLIRDNSQLIRSRSSIRFEPQVSGTPLYETYSVAASAGVPITFRFGLRYDSTYGTATPPTVTVSGLGITPQTFTAGGSANTDYEQTITVTPVSNGNLSVTVSGQSTATTGKYWFSGMSVSPWIDWTWHYGYQYAPASASQTVDANIVASEATAIAYTGLAWSGSTLTISGARTPLEVYEWASAYGAGNHLSQFVSGSPSSLQIAGNLTASVAFSGTVSATGTLTASMTTGGAYTYTGGTLSVGTAVPTFDAGTLNIGDTGFYTFSSTGPIIVKMTPTAPGTYTVGGSHAGTVDLRNQAAHAITVALPTGTAYTTASNVGGAITVIAPPVTHQIQLPSLLDGTRILIYNATTATEIDNDLVSGGGGYSAVLTQGVDYTIGDLIRWVATAAIGTTYYRPQSGSFAASSGIYSMSDAQVAWAEPTAIGVDWTTITECSTDYVSVAVDVSDPDDVGYKSRYALFITGALTEADGIRNWVTLTGEPVITWLTSASVRLDVSVASVAIKNSKSASILRVTDAFAFNWSDGVDDISAVLGSSIVWKNAIDVAVVETGVSGLTSGESAQLAQITTVKNLVEADEVHTATTVEKRLRGTATVLLTKDHTGTPLTSFQAVDP